MIALDGVGALDSALVLASVAASVGVSVGGGSVGVGDDMAACRGGGIHIGGGGYC